MVINLFSGVFVNVQINLLYELLGGFAVESAHWIQRRHSLKMVNFFCFESVSLDVMCKISLSMSAKQKCAYLEVLKGVPL